MISLTIGLMKKLIRLILAFISVGIFAQDSPGVYTIKNAKINTSYSDFGTAFLGNNKVVFASPKEGITFNREEYNSQPFLDLYMGEVTDDGQLIKKQKLPGDINTKFHEGMVSFSKDMKTVYFSANGKIKKVKRKKKKEIKTKSTITIQLFKASIDEKGEWGNLEMLPFNGDEFSTGHPVLNRDDTKLYFVSDRPESLGKTDIFVVDIYEDGTYGQPVNLGPKINTAEREMFPFIGKDNVLYFSSDGFPGYGELDVFASKIFDNTLSAPINLEAPVNSDKDDFAYIIDDGKHKGYFSSNREGGKGDDDIYAFTASPPIYIECQQEISGVVKNIDTQELIPNVQIMLFDENGIKLQSFLSNENDASFSFKQSCNTTYKVKGYLEGYLIGELDIKTVNDLNAEPIEIVMHMGVDPTEEIDAIVDAAEVEKLEKVTVGLAATEIATDKNEEQENVEIATGVTAAEIAADSDDEQENAEIEVVSTESEVEETSEGDKDTEVVSTTVNASEVSVSEIETRVATSTESEVNETSEGDKDTEVVSTTVDASEVSVSEIETRVATSTSSNNDTKIALGLTAAEIATDSDKEQENVEIEVVSTESEVNETSGVAVTEIATDLDKEQESVEIEVVSTESEVNETSGVAVTEIATDSDKEQENVEIEVVSTESEVNETSESDKEDTDKVNETSVVYSVKTTEENNSLSNNTNKAVANESRDLAINDQPVEGESAEEENFNINTIYFDFDKHNIRYDARLQMDKLVKVLREHPQMKIKVNAHTDIRGSRKYNAGLSDKRADETVQYLIKNGIEADRVTGMGFGELQLAEKCTKAVPCNGFQHQLNRRSEFLILKNGTEDFIVRSKNVRNSIDADKNSFTSNSGLFTNYNFYDGDQVYTVQIGAFQGEVQTAKYSKLTNLFHHQYDDGYSRYYAGIFETSSEARNYIKVMKKKGFNDAFVVGLKGEGRN
jgi:outer membrane protein OmpA-like peptidoglycan-associated protein